MKKPNFLIVGAAKSGTTSLYSYLRQHQDIFMPLRKEPHYFVDDTGLGEEEAYLDLFSDWTTEKMAGEASTGYLYAPESPERIYKFLPAMKIIIILRNPVDMAFSLWRHQRRAPRRGEHLSFEKALEVEKDRMADPEATLPKGVWPPLYFYLHRGRYREQVERYLKIFPRDQIFLCLFEELQSDPSGLTRGIYRFLDVDSSFVPDIRVHNIGLEVRFRRFQDLLLSLQTSVGRWGNVPKALAKPLFSACFFLNAKPVDRMAPSTRAMLLRQYREDIVGLQELIHKDLSAWFAAGGNAEEY